MAVNPFPDYPVSRLDASPTSLVTVETDAIEKVRRRIADRVSGRTAPLVVPIRGDYGSGKTHLLLEAGGELNRLLAKRDGKLSTLRLAAIEEDPVGWYRAVIGPRLDSIPLDDVITVVYADAARQVAGRAGLTEGAGVRLSAEPGYARVLVREDMINATAVDEEFRAQLETHCPKASDRVRLALRMLVWQDTRDVAMTWLRGQEGKTASETSMASTPEALATPLTTDAEAAAVLESIAAIHKWAEWPFAVFIDELEHFARPDNRPGRRGNMTWLKRLVEGLAAQDTIVFVAGHWSAWRTQPDVLQRFGAPIDIHKLTGSDVRTIVQTFVPRASVDEESAEEVAEISRGNTRQTLSLLRVLFTATDGFKKPVTREVIEGAFNQIDRRLSPETSLLAVHQVLEDIGLTVERDAIVEPGIRFDLVGSRAGRPAVVVEQKASIHEIAALDQLRRFIEQVREVDRRNDKAIGCFLSDGAPDPEVAAMLNSASVVSNIVWLDATEEDFAIDLRRRLEASLSPPAAVAIGASSRAQFKVGRSEKPGRPDDLSGLAVQIGEVNAARQVELGDVLQQAASRNESIGEREASYLRIRPDDYRERLTVTYEQLTAKPTFMGRLSHLLHLRPLLAIGATLAGLLGLIVGPSTLPTLIVIVAFGPPFVIGFVLVLRYLARIEHFYQQRNAVLRRAYLSSDDAEALLRVYDRMTRLFEDVGPRLRRSPELDPDYFGGWYEP
jgi:hypothetical protein